MARFSLFQDNTRGQEILDIVFRHLNLIETAYFGLRYLDASNQTVSCSPIGTLIYLNYSFTL